MIYSYHFPYEDQALGMIRVAETSDLEDFTIERYDIKSQSWVEDYRMAEIFTGDLPVDLVSEEEAMKIIAGYKPE